MNAPRVLIAAPSSGSGKTTIVCGLLRALADRGLSVASFKCGPDYIDPMFHRRVIGARTGNIDLFFCDPTTARSLFAERSEGADISIIEGVMGYYDGISAASSEGSSHHVARELAAPAILIVDARGQSLSAAATLLGFVKMREPSGIAGVIFNRMSERVWPGVRDAAESIGVLALGYVPKDDGVVISSRHLGLVTPDDVPALREKVSRAAAIIEKTVDVDAVIELARSAPQINACALSRATCVKNIPIAIARDEAFSFLYEENLDLLRSLGAELIFFSPIADSTIPPQARALILPGGYPELHARALSENESMKRSIAGAIASGMPCLAECGGFMYLHDEIVDLEGSSWPMVGAIKAITRPAGRLVRFGYATFSPNGASDLLRGGMTIRGHEFHTYESTDPGDGLTATRPSNGASWRCCHHRASLLAGFPHLFYGSSPEFAKNLLEAASRWQGH